MTINLHVVVSDPNGSELLPGKPKMRILRSHRRGGVVDTKSRPARIIGQTAGAVDWYCSEDQEQVILYSDDDSPNQLVYGSEGAGKSTVLAMWHVLSAMLPLLGEGREIGQVAPNETRLSMVRNEMLRLWPSAWYSFAKSTDLFTFCDGTVIRLQSSHRASEAGGASVQGFNWSACGVDEAQDQTAAMDDITMRGRSAVVYRRVYTATSKDNTDWRDTRDAMLTSGLWQKRLLLGVRSPFVPAKFWDDAKRSMSNREYRRRIMAEDIGIELAVYYAWQRETHIIQAPDIAVDVTTALLKNFKPYLNPAAEFNIVCAHDPGVIYNTTLMLKMKMIGGLPSWIVVDELQTKQTTARAHALELRKRLQSKHYTETEYAKAIVFCDPHGRGTNDTDYQTTYLAFKHEKLNVFSPSYKSISRVARIGMVNRLLLDGANRTRLYVACDQNRVLCAPELVKAFESLQKREGSDSAEGNSKKDEKDMTHSPAALGYGVWQFEQEIVTAETERNAVNAANAQGWRR